LAGKLTQISRVDMAAVIRFSHNAEFARQYLEEGIHARTFRETLMKYSGISDETVLKDRLRSGLASMQGESGGDSLRRKISTWMSGKVTPDSRDQLIRICFALNMTEENAQNFMATAGEGGFHRRNPVELAYLFALRNGLRYEDALRLIDCIRNFRYDGAGRTRLIGQKFDQVHNEQAFIRFVEAECMNLGQMHNTAYHYFQKYMSVLVNPNADFMPVAEKNYTTRDIVQMYLELPGGAGSSVLVKTIKKHWPDEITLSRIINRRVDVPRKVLTLLFLITDGADDSAIETDDVRKQFIDRYRRANQMLDACGYSQLDPRNVFDWLVLFCMYADEESDANMRMRAVLQEVFES